MRKSFIFRALLLALLCFIALNGVRADKVEREINETNTRDAAYRLRGRIIDAKTGEGLPYATVFVLGTSYGASTDIDGNFEVKDLIKGKVTVRASYLGYGTREIVLDSTGDHVIRLEPTAINMEEVVVSANRTETRRNVAPVLVNVTDNKLFASVNALTLDEALKFNPGVRVEDNCQNCGLNQVRINGLEGSYSQVIINSRNIFSALAGVYALEMLPTSMIDRIEVVRGGGSALYGSAAIGGTVNVITKSPLKNTAEVSYTISTVQDNWNKPIHDAGFFASVVDPSHRAGVSVFGKMKSRKGLDLVRPGSVQPGGKDGYTEIAGEQFASVGTSAYYSVGPLSKLVFDYFYIQEQRRGGDRLDRPEHESNVSEGGKHKMHTGILRFDQNVFDGDGFLTAFLAGAHTDRDSYYGGGGILSGEISEKHKNGTLTKEDIESLLAGISAYGNTKDLTFQTGVQYQHQFDNMLFMPAELTTGVEYNYNSLKDRSGYRPAAINQETKITSAFAQNEWKNDMFGFLLGMRYDHVFLKQGDETPKKLDVFTPRVTVRYNPTEHLHLRAGYAHGFRAPQFFDEELHVAFSGGEGKPQVLSPDLREERSRSITFSADYYLIWSNGFKLNLMGEGFYTRLLDKFNTEDRGHVLEVVNASNAKVYGMNFEARLAYTNILSLNLGYTIQRSFFDKEENVGLENINHRSFMRTPDNYGYFLLNWTPNHHLSWSVSGDYTGKMYVPHEAGEKVDGYINVQEDVLVRTNPFFTLGTKVTYCFHMEDAMLELNIGANNIFNSFQRDFDEGPQRAASYMYGPKMPRTIFAGIKVTL